MRSERGRGNDGGGRAAVVVRRIKEFTREICVGREGGPLKGGRFMLAVMRWVLGGALQERETLHPWRLTGNLLCQHRPSAATAAFNMFTRLGASGT